MAQEAEGLAKLRLLKGNFTLDALPLLGSHIPNYEQVTKVEKGPLIFDENFNHIRKDSGTPKGRGSDMLCEREELNRPNVYTKHAAFETKEPSTAKIHLVASEQCYTVKPKGILKNREQDVVTWPANMGWKDSVRTLDNLIRSRNQTLVYNPSISTGRGKNYLSNDGTLGHQLHRSNTSPNLQCSAQVSVTISSGGEDKRGCKSESITQAGYSSDRKDSKRNIDNKRQSLVKKLHKPENTSLSKCSGFEIIESYVESVERSSDEMSNADKNCMAHRTPSPNVQRFSKRGLVKSKSCSNLLSKRKSPASTNEVSVQTSQGLQRPIEHQRSVIDLHHNVSAQTSPSSSFIKIKDFKPDIPTAKHRPLAETLPILSHLSERDIHRKAPGILDRENGSSPEPRSPNRPSRPRLLTSTTRASHAKGSYYSKNTEPENAATSMDDVSSRFSEAESGRSRMALVQTLQIKASEGRVSTGSQTTDTWPGIHATGGCTPKQTELVPTVNTSPNGQFVYMREYRVPFAPLQTPYGSSDTLTRGSSLGSVKIIGEIAKSLVSNSKGGTRSARSSVQMDHRQVNDRDSSQLKDSASVCGQDLPLGDITEAVPSPHEEQVPNSEVASEYDKVDEKCDEIFWDDIPDSISMYHFPEESIFELSEPLMERRQDLTPSIKGIEIKQRVSTPHKYVTQEESTKSYTSQMGKSRPRSVCTSHPSSVASAQVDEGEEITSEVVGDGLQCEKDSFKPMYDQSIYADFQHRRFRRARSKEKTKVSKKHKNNYKGQEDFQQFIKLRIGGEQNSTQGAYE